MIITLYVYDIIIYFCTGALIFFIIFKSNKSAYEFNSFQRHYLSYKEAMLLLITLVARAQMAALRTVEEEVDMEILVA